MALHQAENRGGPVGQRQHAVEFQSQGARVGTGVDLDQFGGSRSLGEVGVDAFHAGEVAREQIGRQHEGKLPVSVLEHDPGCMPAHGAVVDINGREPDVGMARAEDQGRQAGLGKPALHGRGRGEHEPAGAGMAGRELAQAGFGPRTGELAVEHLLPGDAVGGEAGVQLQEHRVLVGDNDAAGLRAHNADQRRAGPGARAKTPVVQPGAPSAGGREQALAREDGEGGAQGRPADAELGGEGVLTGERVGQRAVKQGAAQRLRRLFDEAAAAEGQGGGTRGHGSGQLVTLFDKQAML